MSATLKNFVISLYKIGALKFGDFTLKGGRKSTFYIDLRVIISYPDLMNDVSNLVTWKITKENIKFDCICGVPYTALPISTLVAVTTSKPMVLRRKEPKSYGTKQVIEGKFEKGNRCIIIEDVVTTGSSILETVADIEGAGLIVTDVVLIIDREEGGIEALSARGLKVHSIYKLSELTDILKDENLINSEYVQKIKFEQKRLSTVPQTSKKPDRLTSPFEKRKEFAISAAAAKLFAIMIEKCSNLCIAADVSDIDKILSLADVLGPHVCIFKIHVDIIESYTEREKDLLKNLAAKHNFLIMEDRKLADIGNTVKLQFNQLSKWATLVTAHPFPGFGLLEAIKNAENYDKEIGVFLVAEMSCKSNLITPDYTKKTVALAQNYPELVAGVVSQFSVTNEPGLIQLTPGVNMDKNNDLLGQQYENPEKVVLNRGADIGVVGRGIISAEKPVEAAIRYKEKLWDTYLKRIQK